jgi:hypothetical protein
LAENPGGNPHQQLQVRKPQHFQAEYFFRSYATLRQLKVDQIRVDPHDSIAVLLQENRNFCVVHQSIDSQLVQQSYEIFLLIACYIFGLFKLADIESSE